MLFCAVSLLIVLARRDAHAQLNFIPARSARQNAFFSEPPGDYFIGRRSYNPTDKVWGYVRRPGQPWRAARLVMLNENRKLAPDREANQFGADNHHLYRLYGRFTGDLVYEPATNRVYPEFLLTGYVPLETHALPYFSQY